MFEKTITLQNEEIEKRAAELIIANKELLFQNQEKEKRAAELIVANEELVFQNEEKEKRASELLSLIAGALVTARASGNPSLSETVLAAARVRAHRLIAGEP